MGLGTSGRCPRWYFLGRQVSRESKCPWGANVLHSDWTDLVDTRLLLTTRAAAAAAASIDIEHVHNALRSAKSTPPAADRKSVFILHQHISRRSVTKRRRASRGLFPTGFTTFLLVTDGRTDGHTMAAYTALTLHRAINA